MTRFCSYLGAVLAIGLLFGSSVALAGDEGLYPDTPPPGSAFIRFVNAGNSASAAITVAGKAYAPAPRGVATRYIPTPHGNTRVVFGAFTADAQLEEGSRYCAMIANSKLTVLPEPVDENPMKTLLILINASDAKDVSLKTADGSKNIVEPVAPGTLGSRAVNAVTVPFSVYTGARKIEQLQARSLERGESYAIVVYENDGKTVVSFD